MGIADFVLRRRDPAVATGTNSDALRPARSVTKQRAEFDSFLSTMKSQGGELALHAQTVQDFMDKSEDRRAFGGLASTLNRARTVNDAIGINDYGVKGRRQFAAERRRLLDLYQIVQNSADVRTATVHLRNEVFRRGLEWEPAFEFKCDHCEEEYTEKQAKKLKFVCFCEVEGWDPEIPKVPEDPEARALGHRMRRPDASELKEFDNLLDRCNYFGQSFESLLRACEDDINTVDDGFIFLRKVYEMADYEMEEARQDPLITDLKPDALVVQIFRLDPTLVEMDMDDRGVPGLAHHVCVFHREDILDVPGGEDWDVEWRGVCPKCGIRTYPVYYKYIEQQTMMYGAGRPQTMYLLDDEVIHWSRYSPTETYGYPPVLSIYEKAMTLIGMDRYLYDYFYERKVPQGVVTVTTDDVPSFNAAKLEVEAKMAQDPHFVPWIAISSKTGMGKMEFVRFAYSLDELDYLPVRDEIRERIAGMYGVSQIWMQSTEGIGGLNSESQQLTVMSRVVEGAQRNYHTDVFPKLQKALGIEDWYLRIKTPEESNELVELQILQTKAAVAQTMAGMGFGVEYNSEDEEFTFNGRVLSMEDQQKAQMQGASPFGAGGAAPAAAAGAPAAGAPTAGQPAASAQNQVVGVVGNDGSIQPPPGQTPAPPASPIVKAVIPAGRTPSRGKYRG